MKLHTAQDVGEHSGVPHGWFWKRLGAATSRTTGSSGTSGSISPVPVHPPETAGERVVEYLLRQEVAKAKAA